MSKARGELAERGELLALLLDFGIRAHAIGQHADEALRKLRQVLQTVRQT